jgi:DNA repair protein RecO (recombination protein O)
MQNQCLGIVIRTIKYGDSGIIAQILTDKYGMQSFLVKGVHSKKTKLKISLFGTLNILQLQIHFKENRNIQSIREATPEFPMHNSHSDIVKNAMLLYVADVMKECLKSHPMADNNLFQFLMNTISQIENCKVDSHFPLKFMIELSQHLGFSILHSSDLHFVSDDDDNHALGFLSDGEGINKVELFREINLGNIQLNKAARKKMLNTIHEHFKQHLDDKFSIKSAEVLEEVFL